VHGIFAIIVPVTTKSIALIGLFGFRPAMWIFTYSGIDAGFGGLVGGGGGGLVIILMIS
jgi:hypothetical protein